MIDANGIRLCDKEIWSRKYSSWIGCRCLAVVNVKSDYIVSGLDFCEKHAGKTVWASRDLKNS